MLAIETDAPVEIDNPLASVAFGARLKDARQRSGLSQVELAERLNYSKQMISAVEIGRAEPPRRYILQMAEILNVSPAWLAFGLDDGTFVKRPPRSKVITIDDLRNLGGNSGFGTGRTIERLTGSDKSIWIQVPDDAMAPILTTGDLIFRRPGSQANARRNYRLMALVERIALHWSLFSNEP